jgi:plastocyanin
MRRSAKLLPVALVVAVAGALAVQSGAATKSKTIKVDDDFFSPKSVTVKKGTALKYTFVGSDEHDVVAKGKKPFSNIGDQTSGTFTRVAKKKGTFKIICTIHDGMSMKLKVK